MFLGEVISTLALVSSRMTTTGSETGPRPARLPSTAVMVFSPGVSRTPSTVTVVPGLGFSTVVIRLPLWTWSLRSFLRTVVSSGTSTVTASSISGVEVRSPGLVMTGWATGMGTSIAAGAALGSDPGSRPAAAGLAGLVWLALHRWG